MTERQYIVRSLFRLSAQLADHEAPAAQREFAQRALQFYAKRLSDMDRQQHNERQYLQ